ncbi:polyadenylate-binding protein 1 [Patella vulgata]|uniref:polyadenylate-binding protein 1 n=1 Tax=Patella vulgata TaxID=6465 RepID=UPI0021801F04|nr:polyadenylate-binding protein 1 [Patella vulgata]
MCVERGLRSDHWVMHTLTSLNLRMVAADEQGSKGHGYIQFKTEEAAKQAIEKVNGTVLKDKKVYVGKFIPQSERLAMMSDRPKKYNNVYIKNFGNEYDDDKLKVEMEKFGKVVSAKVMTDQQNISRGFGFVCFEDPEDAENCVDHIMGSELNGKILYASPAQKRAERRVELKEKFELSMREGVNGYQRVNLYVKNLDGRIDDEQLRKEFSDFGTITSAKVMRDGIKSKGFGFVCFSSPEEATKAVTEMNGRIVYDRPLYVALAQRKEERRVHLASQYTQRITTMRQQQSAQYSQMFQPSGAGYFVPQLPQATRGFFTPTQMPQVKVIPRWKTVVREPTPWREAVAFDVASPTKQRQMLGNRLFPLINDMYPKLAGRITDMLLEIDKSELLDMLDSPGDLRDEVENAVSWLNKRYQPEQS